MDSKMRQMKKLVRQYRFPCTVVQVINPLPKPTSFIVIQTPNPNTLANKFLEFLENWDKMIKYGMQIAIKLLCTSINQHPKTSNISLTSTSHSNNKSLLMLSNMQESDRLISQDFRKKASNTSKNDEEDVNGVKKGDKDDVVVKASREEGKTMTRDKDVVLGKVVAKEGKVA